jgi:DNA-binding NarL/FixJ family response regulator
MCARTAPPKPRIMIIDDHPLVRRALRQLLSQETDLEVLHEAHDAESALRLASTTPLDLILMDLSLKESSGTDLIKRIHAQFPGTRVLVFSMFEDRVYASRALRAGAAGYVNKQAPIEELIGAIRQVLGGKVYLNSHVADADADASANSDGVPNARQAPHDLLSDRELEIFELIGRGSTTRAIAQRLHVSVKTVETHRENIKRKLGLSRNIELIQHSYRWVLELPRSD